MLLARRCAMMVAFTLFFALSALQPVLAQEATGSGDASGSDAASGLSPEQAQALIDILSDPGTREALISTLEEQAGSDAGPGEAGASTDAEAEAAPSFGRQLAEKTQSFAENAAKQALVFWQRLARLPGTISRVSDISPDVIVNSVVDLALVFAATLAVFLIVGFAARRFYDALARESQEAGALRTALLIGAKVLIDAAVVIVAWASGYALALLVFGDLGEIGLVQTLYLNAFLTVEMVKVIVRAVLAPSTSDLRPVSLPDRGARSLSRWLSVSISLIGYGQLLIVPILNLNIAFAAGSALSLLISALVILIAIALVLNNRRDVAAWLLGEKHLEEKSGLLRFLARKWHVPVLIYLVVVLGIVLSRPGGVLIPVLYASGKIVAAGLAGMVAAHILKQAIQRGISLPERVNEQLPLLERRLNAFIPKALFVLRFLIILAVIGFTIDTVDLVDVQFWLESQVGVEFTGMLISVAMILIVAFAIWLAFSSWIDFRLNPDFGKAPTAREQTLLSLLRNAVTIVLIVITAMFALSEIGIDIAPLIASAGVLGLAIGFGAQKLVQDIITGVFIQFENAMNVGDVVTVGGTTGTVERLTIRSVSLRDLHGAFHIVPFSSVDMVSNYMRDFAFFVCDMGIAYRESVDEAKQAMLDGFDELRQNPDWSGFIIGDLQWFGLNSFGDSAVVVRARIKCVPGQQWGVGRAYNEILKRIFDERGIEIPFPHQTLYFGEDRKGEAPALRVARVNSENKVIDQAEPRSEGTAKAVPPTDDMPMESDVD